MIKYFKSSVFVLFLFSFNIFNVEAQQKHAVLIGINNYLKADSLKFRDQIVRPACKDLTGSINNVDAMADILTARFEFKQEDMKVMTNERATKAEILKSLEGLKGQCKKGDAVFFYFSGYGSQVANSALQDSVKTDNILVPYDGIYKGNYVRLKELSDIFVVLINKGVKLTAVFECSYGSSTQRGIKMQEEAIPLSTETINDAKEYPDLKNYGALVISAAQDNKSAYVKKYNDEAYGVFTKAIIDVMKYMKSNTPANEFCSALTSYIRDCGESQVPAVICNEWRSKFNLAGAESENDILEVTATKINADKTIVLQGGSSIGIVPGTELMNETNTLKIEVTGNNGISQSTAKIMAGSYADIRPGMAFKVSRWALAPGKKFGICLPACNLKRKELIAMADSMQKIIYRKSIFIPGDYQTATDYVVYYNVSKWFLNTNGTDHDLGAKFDFPLFSSLLEPEKTIEIRLPLYKELYTNISSAISNKYSGISITDIGSSDYHLSGMFAGNMLFYYMLKTERDTSPEALYPAVGYVNTVDSVNENRIAAELCESAFKLGRIHSWMSLQSTDKQSDYPYDFYLKRYTTGKMIGGGTVKEDDDYRLFAVKNPLKNNPDTGVKKRWIYILDIRSDNTISLSFPFTKQNDINYIPSIEEDSLQEEVPPALMMIPPYGGYTIVILETDDAISDPSRFEKEDYAGNGASGNALEGIIDDINSKMPGKNILKAPSGWAIQKIRLNVVPRE